MMSFAIYCVPVTRNFLLHLLVATLTGTCRVRDLQFRILTAKTNVVLSSYSSTGELGTNECSFRDGFKMHSGCGSVLCKLCFYLRAHDSSVWEYLYVLPDTLVPGSYSVFLPIVCRLLPSCFSFVMKEIKIKWAGP